VTVNQDPNVTLTVERVIPATPAVVFQAWLDPQALARFMCPAPGMTVGRVTVDPRVGGDFLIVMKTGDQEMPHHGTYQVIDPPHRLVFSWHSKHAGMTGDSQVTLTLPRPRLTPAPAPSRPTCCSSIAACRARQRAPPIARAGPASWPPWRPPPRDRAGGTNSRADVTLRELRDVATRFT
jgi:uncharacterized protein YndB with AHSA1/START domain